MPDETVPVVRRKKKTFVVQGSKPEEVMTGKGKQPDKPVVKAVVRKKAAKPEYEKTSAEANAEPVKEKPGKKLTKSQKANRRNHDKLIERWPELFCHPPRPLAIGVYDDLRAQLDPEEGHSWLKRGIYNWCNRWIYKKALAEGGPRYNLSGESGEVTEEEQAFARQCMEERKQLKEAEKERRKLEKLEKKRLED